MKPYLVRSSIEAALLASVLVLGGCAESPNPDSPGSCRSDSECGGGICNTQVKVCMPAASAAPALEVWPPAGNNQGWVVQEFPNVKLGDDGELLVPLQPGVTVQGSVYVSDGSLKSQRLLVPARIVAYRDSLLPNRPKVQFETSQVVAKRDAPQGYVLWVNRGHSYTFYVAPKEPHDKMYPPLVKTDVRVDNHTPLDFALEGDDRAVTVSGRIFIYPTQALPSGLTVRVRAYRPGGLEQSTVAETDADGKFTFKVPGGVLPYTIRVETAPGLPEQPARPIPTMECTGRVLGLVQTDNPSQDLGNLMLPVFAPPEKPFTVAVKSKDGDPVPNATVTFTCPVPVAASQNIGYDSCAATYSQSGITDAEGRSQLLLLAAEGKQNRTYSVTVVTPPESRFASRLIQKLEVGPSPGVLQTIELDRRHRIAGTVVSSTGKLVPGAVIEAQGIGAAATNDVEGLPPGAATANSNQQGAFELFMDPGVYNIDVRPADGSGLPSVCMTAKLINSAFEGLRLTLPEPHVLRGRVVATGSQAVEVPNAQVNVYEQVPDLGWPVVTLRADLRARSVTDGTGAFYLLLPPSAVPSSH